MKVFTAPTEPFIEDYYNKDNIKVFLAGGITNCPDWQSEVIEYLEKFNLDNLLVFNPRRKNFDISDKDANQKQIEWEFNHLNDMDIFAMYFCNSESNQPICLYELGRYLEKMQHRFPLDWQDRIIIGIEDGYSRTQDVVIQSGLATGVKFIAKEHMTPERFANVIRSRYEWLMN